MSYDAARREVVVLFPRDHIGRHDSGEIILYRPSASNEDRSFAVTPDVDGRQVLDVSGLPAGPWSVRVSWQVDGVDYLINERIIIRDS